MIGSAITISAKLQKILCSVVSDDSSMTNTKYPVPSGPYELLHRKATGLPDDYVPNGGQCVVEPGQYFEVGLGWTWTAK